jgi:hypothetical protein
MTVHELKETLKGIPPNSDVVFYPEGAAEDENGNPLLAGIGVFNMETHEFAYLGDITVIEHD